MTIPTFLHSGHTVATSEQQDSHARDGVSSQRAFKWPRKLDLFGVAISPTTYNHATAAIVDAARSGRSAVVSCHAVHAVVTASDDPSLRDRVNSFDMVTPDGQPVRWALNLLHGAKLSERVYGPELMRRVCGRAARDGVPIYLYGSTPAVLEALRANLLRADPSLKIAGSEAPPFRVLSLREDQAVVNRINSSGAGVVFIGLGCPKQDIFAYEHRTSIRAVQVCVGAAFDLHAGVRTMAPKWMQRHGLEWTHRLSQEPRRLWRRYLSTNRRFILKLAVALCQREARHHRASAAAAQADTAVLAIYKRTCARGGKVKERVP